MRRGVWAAAVLALTLTGCAGAALPKAVNIAELRLIRTLAVDLPETGEGVRLTVCGDVEKDSAGGESRAPLLLTQTGESLTAAGEKLNRAGEGRLEYGHTEECVIGEALAMNGIGDVVDTLERDGSVRTGTKLFLLRQGEGEQALRAASGEHTSPTQHLTALSEDTRLGGGHWRYTLRQYISDMEDNGEALLPVLELRGEGEELSLRLSGLGWMQGHRLGGYYTEEESRGLCLLTGENQGDWFRIPLPQGAACVELVKSRVSWKPLFDEKGALTGASAQVEVYGKVTQLPEGVSLQNRAQAEKLRRAWLAQVETLCRAALTAGEDRGADVLHLRRTLCGASPLRGKEITAGFARSEALEWTVEVTGAMGKTYDTDRAPVAGGTAE